MSTKTLRKRIALVAVSAMGFGLLTSVSANASSFNTGAMYIDEFYTPAGNSLNWNEGTNNQYPNDAGVCYVNNDDTIGVLNSGLFLGNYIAIGLNSSSGQISSGESAKFVVSGPAVIVNSNDKWYDGGDLLASALLSSDGKTFTFKNIDEGTVYVSNYLYANNVGYDGSWDGQLYVKPTGPGKIVIKSFKTTNSGTTQLDTITTYLADKCDNGTYSAADSVMQMQTSPNWLSESEAADVTGDETGAGLRKFSEKGYIALYLADKYGGAISSTSNYLSASATNGAIVGWDGDPASGATTAILSGNSYYENPVLYVANGTDVTAPVSTTVTISLNGTVIATKSIKFSGEAAKIKLGTTPAYLPVNDSAPSAQDVKYTLEDAAGNRVAGEVVAGASTANTNSGSALSIDTTTTTAPGKIRLIGGAKEGDSVTTVRFKLSDGSYLVSDPIKFKTVESDFDTFTVSLDKATTTPGAVVTLTVTGKNSKGSPVADGTYLGGTVTWVGENLKPVTDNPADSDKSVNGVWTYKFYAPTTEGTFGFSLKTDAATVTTSAQTGTFSVAANGVSNAEVLAAIVKLIASINKQIAALQKLLSKKK